MVVFFIVFALSIVLMIYLAVMYLVKCLLEFYKDMIEWRVLRFLLTAFTLAVVVLFHVLIIRIVIAIL